ncbi:MAG: DUF2157 domain-containing protein [Azospirillum sp.]|nr:DUF2157 domain-containing protein [Azospirillum sp.]
MIERGYRQRLERDLKAWAERGWLAPGGREAILAELTARGGRRRLSPLILGGLGALLLAVGVILFVAANWPAIPRPAKVTMVFGLLWASHGAALALSRAGSRRFAEAMVLLGALLFGAAILLIGQAYNLPPSPTNGLLLWTAGSLAAAWVWPSRLCAALALAAIWGGIAHAEAGDIVFWPFPAVWALIAVPILYYRWQPAWALAVLVLGGWIAISVATTAAAGGAAVGDVLRLAAAAGLGFVTAARLLGTTAELRDLAPPLRSLGLLAIAAATVVLTVPEVHEDVALGTPMSRAFWQGGLVLALASAGTLALLARRDDKAPLLLAAFVIGAHGLAAAAPAGLGLIGFEVMAIAGWLLAITLAERDDDRFLLRLGFTGFAATLLIVYFSWFWSLLDRSLFFIGGGALVVALGWALERRRRRPAAKSAASEAAAAP